jgi:hypothetical protein
MKKRYYLLIVSVALISMYAVLQSGSESSADVRSPIAKELEKWDPIRGEWLAASLDAMSENRPIPDRMFPEDLTPHQMISLLPDDIRSKLAHLSRTTDLDNLAKKQRFESIRTMVEPVSSNCGTMSARTYGDPHLVTFDGARYSFQTVGEFVLTRSNSGMEVQTRQKPEKKDFSLNTAVAMNVGGDRVGIYASDYPNANSSTPVWVNGRPITFGNGRKYFLPNGGIIRQKGSSNYTVDWPSGESVTAVIKTSSGMRFMNVNLTVSECSRYDGLLGNANGNASDDFGGLNEQASIRIPEGRDAFTGSSREIEQSRLAYIANAMGDKYRITPSRSLFDYAPGTSTYTFTDRAFPRVHRTLEEISQEQRDEARRICKEEAIRDEDLNGCIFDQVYLDLRPARETVVKDPTAGIEFRPIIDAVANVNPKPTRPNVVTRPIENVSNALPASERPLNGEGSSEVESNETALRDILIAEAQIDRQKEKEEARIIRELDARDRRERLEKEANEAEEIAEAARDKRQRQERDAERERLEKDQREERERDQREERAAAERAEREREVHEREEAERVADKREKEEQEREERAEREARKKAEAKDRAEAERKKEAAAKKAREEAAQKSKEEAAKKAREEAAQKSKEEAAKKAREEALKKSRDRPR